MRQLITRTTAHTRRLEAVVLLAQITIWPSSVTHGKKTVLYTWYDTLYKISPPHFNLPNMFYSLEKGKVGKVGRLALIEVQRAEGPTFLQNGGVIKNKFNIEAKTRWRNHAASRRLREPDGKM